MIYERVKVEIGNAVQATLFLYLHESYPETYGDRKRPLVLICPGGGYEHVSVREGEPIAFQFLTAGCHAAVLWDDISRQGAESRGEKIYDSTDQCRTGTVRVPACGGEAV